MVSVVYSLKKAVAVFMALFLMIGISYSAESHCVSDEENCKLNFSVLSDVHMEGNNKTSRDAFIKMMYDVKNNKSGNDSLVFLGDNTMNGQNIENMFFFGILKMIDPAETVYAAMGNHDTGNGIDQYDKLSSRFFNYYNAFYNDSINSPYYYKVVNGYYFVFLGAQSDCINNSVITTQQLDWLNGVLAEATENGKPVFVFNHHPYNYLTENVDLMTRVLSCYDNVFYFSGHTHTYEFSAYDIAEGTHHFNLPRCTEQDDDGKIMQGVCGIGVQVEVYDDYVNVRLRDFYGSEWVTDYVYPLV